MGSDSVVDARLTAIERELKQDVPLREYFDARLAAVEKASTLAAATLEKRLEGMNEFRDTLKDQASRFVTRDELALQIKANREAINELRTFKDRLEGKASASSVYVTGALAIIGIITSVLGLLFK